MCSTPGNRGSLTQYRKLSSLLRVGPYISIQPRMTSPIPGGLPTSERLLDRKAIFLHYWPSLRSRRLHIGRVLFGIFIDQGEVEVTKTQKKDLASIQPS